MFFPESWNAEVLSNALVAFGRRRSRAELSVAVLSFSRYHFGPFGHHGDMGVVEGPHVHVPQMKQASGPAFALCRRLALAESQVWGCVALLFWLFEGGPHFQNAVLAAHA